MSRCTATPPCTYPADTHEPACPARSGLWSDPELDRLYATATPVEESRLEGALVEALLAAGLAEDHDTEELTADEPVWLALRQAIRDGATAVAAARLVRAHLAAGEPELSLVTQ